MSFLQDKVDWGSDEENEHENLTDLVDWGSDLSDSEDDIENFDPLSFVEIGNLSECEVSKRFGLKASCFYMTFKNSDKIPDAELVARTGIEKVLKKAFQKCKPSDLVGIAISHPALDTDIMVQFGNESTVTCDKVMDTINNVQQSKRELDFSHHMLLKFTIISPPTGEGYMRMSRGRFEEFFKKNSTGPNSIFIPIENSDSLCFPRAVVVGRARIQHHRMGDKSVKLYQIVKGDRYRLQKDLAVELISEAGLMGFNGKRGWGIPEYKEIQRVLVKQGFQLKIFSHDHFDCKIFDEEIMGLLPIYIYHHNNHYSSMSTPRILTGTNYWCDLCSSGFNRKDSHKCSRICDHCRTPGVCPSDPVLIPCDCCRRFFKSKICFENHKKVESQVTSTHGNGRKRTVPSQAESLCYRLRKCLKCGRTLPRTLLSPPKHRCGQNFCRVCKVLYPQGEMHQCFMQPIRGHSGNSGNSCFNEEEQELLGLDEEDSDGEKEDTLITPESENVEDEEPIRKKKAPSESRKKPITAKYIFWDFETIQQDEIGEKIIRRDGKEFSLGPIFEHKPNYCVARKACMRCKDFWLANYEFQKCQGRDCEKCQLERPNCDICKTHYHRFVGEDCRDQFCDFLFSEENRGITAIAHNASGKSIAYCFVFSPWNKPPLPHILIAPQIDQKKSCTLRGYIYKALHYFSSCSFLTRKILSKEIITFTFLS